MIRTNNSDDHSYRKLKIWVDAPPYSSDPIDFDYANHVSIFHSLFSPLVSKYKKGGYTGIIAKNWESNNDFKTWRLKIAEDFILQDGRSITPVEIASSIIRIAHLLKVRGSKNGFLEFLEGFDQISSPVSKIGGLVSDSNFIVFNFIQSMPGFLDKIGMSLYLIAPYGSYDLVDGKWIKNPHRIVSSGPYKLTNWNEKSISFERRPEYPENLLHKRVYNELEYYWRSEDRSSADLIVDKSVALFPGPEFKFYGGANSNIAFIRCHSWNNKNSVLFSKSNRQFIRDTFYGELNRRGIKITKSFLPLTVKNVHVSETPGFEGIVLAGDQKTLKFRPFRQQFLIFSVPYENAVKESAHRLGIKAVKTESSISDWFQEFDPNLKEYKFDLSGAVTDIFLEDPVDDLRFMFFSKEGIRLPDPTGKISVELKKEKVDFGKVNQMLWEDAIIWPISHFSAGIWVKETIDVSMLNLLFYPAEFHWLGAK